MPKSLLYKSIIACISRMRNDVCTMSCHYNNFSHAQLHQVKSCRQSLHRQARRITSIRSEAHMNRLIEERVNGDTEYIYAPLADFFPTKDSI